MYLIPRKSFKIRKEIILPDRPRPRPRPVVATKKTGDSENRTRIGRATSGHSAIKLYPNTIQRLS